MKNTSFNSPRAVPHTAVTGSSGDTTRTAATSRTPDRSTPKEDSTDCSTARFTRSGSHDPDNDTTGPDAPSRRRDNDHANHRQARPEPTPDNRRRDAKNGTARHKDPAASRDTSTRRNTPTRSGQRGARDAPLQTTHPIHIHERATHRSRRNRNHRHNNHPQGQNTDPQRAVHSPNVPAPPGGGSPHPYNNPAPPERSRTPKHQDHKDPDPPHDRPTTEPQTPGPQDHKPPEPGPHPCILTRHSPQKNQTPPPDERHNPHQNQHTNTTPAPAADPQDHKPQDQTQPPQDHQHTQPRQRYEPPTHQKKKEEGASAKPTQNTRQKR